MFSDIRDNNASCAICQAKKDPTQKTRTPLIPISEPTEVFHTVATDIIGPLYTTPRGNKYIIVLCLFTKYAKAFPLKDITAKTVTQVFLNEICFRYGSCLRLLSDQGANYT